MEGERDDADLSAPEERLARCERKKNVLRVYCFIYVKVCYLIKSIGWYQAVMWMPARTRRHIPSALLATLLDILTTNRGRIELVETHVDSLGKPRQLLHYYSDLNYCQCVFYGIRSSTRSKSDCCCVSPTFSCLFWTSIIRECNTHIQMR